MKAQKPLELWHVILFIIYIVITIACIAYAQGYAIEDYVKGLGL